MKAIAALILALLSVFFLSVVFLPRPAHAAASPCRKDCHRPCRCDTPRRDSCVTVVRVECAAKSIPRGDDATHGGSARTTVTTPSLADALRDGFSLRSGWRWHDEASPCLPPHVAPTSPHAVDPFFVGVGLEIPLTSHVAAFGTFDRDWREAPRFTAAAGVSFKPFAR